IHPARRAGDWREHDHHKQNDDQRRNECASPLHDIDVNPLTSPNDRTPATPRHAATAILLREAREIEVLVIRRHENLAFMGGMWVFPGGTLSPADTSTAALA